jgi:hypothetical protein
MNSYNGRGRNYDVIFLELCSNWRRAISSYSVILWERHSYINSTEGGVGTKAGNRTQPLQTVLTLLTELV